MGIPFYKMQGAGNDFIVLNNLELGFTKERLAELAKRVCQVKLSVGSDALMVVDRPEHGGHVRMIFFNADGTEAEMCGNGARCLARFAYETGLAPAEMVIETVAGDVKAWRLDQRKYKVQLNAPTKIELDLAFDDEVVTKVDYIELGDPAIPHLVVHYPGLSLIPLTDIRELATRLRFWEELPKGANVNFYELLDNGEVLVRTFERGVEDFTFACGTGSGSTALVLTKKALVTKNPVVLHVLGGILEVEVFPEALNLIGDTNIVVIGEITDEDVQF
ncbi:MAG: diaminopimelate epimerase [Enterococcus sp.]